MLCVKEEFCTLAPADDPVDDFVLCGPLTRSLLLVTPLLGDVLVVSRVALADIRVRDVV